MVFIPETFPSSEGRSIKKQMFNHGTQRQGRQKTQGPDHDDDGNQPEYKKGRVGFQGSGAYRHLFFMAREPAIARVGMMIQYRLKNMAKPSAVL